MPLDQEPQPRKPLLGEDIQLFVGTGVQDLLQQQLFAPLIDLLSRPSKKFRGPLVEFGFRIGADETGSLTNQQVQLFETLSSVVEYFHAASLAIDDIQDDSATRRGRPSLHKIYGQNVALNAGNWLYFWPFEMIEALELPMNVSFALQTACRRTLLRAHYGQALDVGINISQIPQSRIHNVVLASLELKSGALMSLPMELGAILSGLGEQRAAAIRQFGHRFGIALQMFNDLGNFWGGKEPEKKMEDLKHRRPSWLWGSLASTLEPREFAHFMTLVDQLPDEEPVTSYLDKSGYLERAKVLAYSFLNEAFEELEDQFSSVNARTIIIPQLRELGAKIARSYE